MELMSHLHTRTERLQDPHQFVCKISDSQGFTIHCKLSRFQREKKTRYILSREYNYYIIDFTSQSHRHLHPETCTVGTGFVGYGMGFAKTHPVHEYASKISENLSVHVSIGTAMRQRIPVNS